MGRWHNDIKKATVKCRSSMAEPNASLTQSYGFGSRGDSQRKFGVLTNGGR